MARPKNTLFLPLIEAKNVVHRENLSSLKAYRDWVKLSGRNDLPLRPEHYYVEWKGAQDFLGKSTHKRNRYTNVRNFEDALNYARKSNIRTSNEWMKFREHPIDIPSRPDQVYRDKGFRGWKHFLGTGNRVAQYAVDQRPQKWFAFFTSVYSPSNVFTIKTFTSHEAIRKFSERFSVSVARVFKCNPKTSEMVNQHAAPFGVEGFKIDNVDQLMFEILMEEL